ncbi:MAG: GNAT family N-acetyltransferase, partial [Methylobacteriaceae bacterium]
MLPNFSPREATAAWKAGWETKVQAPFARFRQTFEGGDLALPGGAPILLKNRAKRPLLEPGLDPSLGRIGALEVRLATTKSEIRRAQRLRYRVFYEEMSAVPTGMAALKRRDVDAYDAICDHLLVIDHAATDAKPFRKARPKVVGTYRLLRQDRAEAHLGFY